ncbi:MAG: HNH endonuclease [Nitrospinae bacterium]|nr:HNH endonuclease [Nitrospinota bacterium]
MKKKKSNFLKRHGKLFCEACGFDYEKTYGGRGVGFIECHHTKPVHTLSPKEKTKLEDLRLLCANCHRMVHAKAPWLSMEELRALLGSK